MPDERMNVEIIVTDSAGHRFAGSAELKLRDGRSTRKHATHRPTRFESNLTNEIDFTLQPRAFIKRYAKGMRGPQKFVLLTAKLSGGKTTNAIDLKVISRHWDKMTGLLGDFNTTFAVRAGDNGWVSSPKRGTYLLRSNWAEIFGLER
jgi:hypothetical protein